MPISSSGKNGAYRPQPALWEFERKAREMDDFSNRCRQRFISEKYFRWLAGLLNEHIALWEHTLPANGSEMQKRTTSALAPGRYLPDTA